MTIWALTLAACLAFFLSLPESQEVRDQRKAQRWARKQSGEG